jgi:hypothetical protein
MKADNIVIGIKISLWGALKLRLAGIANVLEKGLQEGAEKPLDVGTIRINKYTGKPEMCVSIERLGTKPDEINDEWVDYTADLLYHTMGICPKCGEIYSLIKFRQKMIEEAKKIKEEEKTKTKEDTGEGANYTHRHDTRVLDEAQNAINARIKEAEDAGLDPAMLFLEKDD